MVKPNAQQRYKLILISFEIENKNKNRRDTENDSWDSTMHQAYIPCLISNGAFKSIISNEVFGELQATIK